MNEINCMMETKLTRGIKLLNCGVLHGSCVVPTLRTSRFEMKDQTRRGKRTSDKFGVMTRQKKKRFFKEGTLSSFCTYKAPQNHTFWVLFFGLKINGGYFVCTAILTFNCFSFCLSAVYPSSPASVSSLLMCLTTRRSISHGDLFFS